MLCSDNCSTWEMALHPLQRQLQHLASQQPKDAFIFIFDVSAPRRLDSAVRRCILAFLLLVLTCPYKPPQTFMCNPAARTLLCVFFQGGGWGGFIGTSPLKKFRYMFGFQRLVAQKWWGMVFDVCPGPSIMELLSHG